jgi:sec-independent protein translocase protein TatA
VTANILGSDGLIVLIIAAVVLFGGSQLPKLAKNVGAAGHEFRKAQREAEADHLANEKLATATPVMAPVPQLVPDDKLVLSRSELKLELAKLMDEHNMPAAG